MGHITDNLFHVHRMIEDACTAAKRSSDEVQLLCVSKTRPSDDIIEAYKAGQRRFAESYISEAVPKIAALKASGFGDIKWHFIGPLQSNKTKAVAENFDAVQSVDRVKLLKRLNEQRPDNLKPLEVLIEVNISGQSQKSGCSMAQLDDLIAPFQSFDRLKLRGLMGIAADTCDKELIKKQFDTLKSLFDKYKTSLNEFDMLSMGMTGDLKEAVLCGSTQVRIGTAVFGPRNYEENLKK